MKQNELRYEYLKILSTDTVEERQKLLDTFIHCFFEMIIQPKAEADQIKNYAKIILKMIVSKLIHIKKMFEGINYVNKADVKLLSSLIDPTVIAVLVRNLFETICAFHLIFINTKTQDQRKIVYNLWQIAGLNYRQKFRYIALTEESKIKADAEEDAIKRLIEEVKATNLFSQLDEVGKSKIMSRIKEKNFQVSFTNNGVELLSWSTTSKLLLKDQKILKEMYNLFSLYAHPSYVSVLQYSQMFNNNDKFNESLGKTMLEFCLTLSSIFMADFIKFFPEMLDIFEKQSDLDQILMNLDNLNFRGREFSINNASEKLE